MRSFLKSIVSISESFDMKSIKELRDGLTINTIKKKFSWLLTCSFEDAILGLDKKGDLVWYDGTFYMGTWKGGTWKGGTWSNGEFLKGKWEGGVWKYGYGKPDNAD